MDKQSFHWTNYLDMIRLTIDMRVIKKKIKQDLFNKKKAQFFERRKRHLPMSYDECGEIRRSDAQFIA